MDKRFWAIIGVVVVVFGAILVFHNHSANDTSSNSSSQPTNHIEGNTSSKVTLLEYGDYQCPVCENYFQAVQAVQQKYNATVKFQFRNLPLPMHPNALAAARAAEAADLQGKFWQMHDLLYQAQNYHEWALDASGQVSSADPMPFFKSYATQLGLNITKFQQDFASAAVNNRAQADTAAFKQTKQPEGTPAFFINGTYVSNEKLGVYNDDGSINVAPTVANFSKFLDDALKSAQ